MSSQNWTVSRILHIARLTNNPESRLLCLTVMHRHRRVAVVKSEALYPQSQSGQTQGRNVVTNHRLHCCICDHWRHKTVHPVHEWRLVSNADIFGHRLFENHCKLSLCTHGPTNCTSSVNESCESLSCESRAC